MNGRKIFCLSLIVLSVTMGIHWFKHRPKVKKVKRKRPRVALNIDDLQIQDNKTSDTKPQETKMPEKVDPGNTQIASETSNTTDNASSSEPLFNASETSGLNADPIIFAFNHLTRNPFERSPYVKLANAAKKDAEEKEVEDVSGKGKETKLLKAEFSATIKTNDDLVAVIDNNLYRKGEMFRNGRISSISTELVFVNTATTLFIIPKVGVNLKIASDGVYTYNDSFRE